MCFKTYPENNSKGCSGLDTLFHLGHCSLDCPRGLHKGACAAGHGQSWPAMAGTSFCLSDVELCASPDCQKIFLDCSNGRDKDPHEGLEGSRKTA